MLSLTNVTKKFDAVVALDDAFFQVEKGEIMALLGSNGSGKSTMVKIVSGLVNPNNAEIKIDDEIINIQSARDSRNLGISVAYQDLSLIQNMSVADNIVLGAEPKKGGNIVDKKVASEKATELLKKLKIDCKPQDLIRSLPPSKQSMIEVAKALYIKPKYLFLDEVTASLHHDEVDILFDVLEELKQNDVAVIMVTHRMEEIFRICDRCTILKGGDTVATGKISEMDLDEIIFHMTGKKPEKIAHNEDDNFTDSKEAVLNITNMKLIPRIKDISFTAKKGEIVGIGGLEGQGQSQFIRAVLGVKRLDSGVIEYHGEEVHFTSPAQAVSKNIGFVSGDRMKEAVFPIRSVSENIFAGKVAKGKMFGYLSPKEIYAFAQKAVDEFNILVGGLNHPASSLSGGNQQKLVLGRWIAIAPDLLLLDDPTKGVDINSRREIHKILKNCTENGMTVIISSSDNNELLEIADRIYVFYEGRVSGLLSGNNKIEEKLVAAMMGVNEAKGGDVSHE